jgi:hypothetical protein
VIELRRATFDDAAAVAEVFLTSFHETYDFPLAHTDDDVRGWIRDRLIPTQETWVAVDDDRVVAMMALTPGHLEQLYVAPDQLGRGIVAVELTDGDNEEGQPDVRYEWRGNGSP